MAFLPRRRKQLTIEPHGLPEAKPTLTDILREMEGQIEEQARTTAIAPTLRPQPQEDNAMTLANPLTDARARRIRSVATNAVLELMIYQGRQIMTDADAATIAMVEAALGEVAADASAQAPMLNGGEGNSSETHKRLTVATAAAQDERVEDAA